MFTLDQKVRVKETKLSTYPQRLPDIIPAQDGVIEHIGENFNEDEYGIMVKVIEGHLDSDDKLTGLKTVKDLVYFKAEELEAI